MSGSHRGRPRRLRAFAPAALASVVAVALVVAAIVLVDVFHHHGSGSTGSPAVSAPATLSATTPTPTSSSPTPTPTATRTTPKPSVKKTVKPTTKPPAAVATPAPASTPVEVFNNSRVAHRAELAASRLRAAGYPVSHTATRPTYPGAEVVYYPAGNASLEAAARGVVARHIGIAAAEPRPASIPAYAGLIVVVGASYT